MGKKFLIIGGALAAILTGWRGDLRAQQAPPTVVGQADQALPQPEVLEQGPIHEAFAEPLALQRQERETITKQPPEQVRELPPDEQPEGQNVQWIPGYWMWDQGRTDFVWVSGLWRDVPPGRTWMPGEWQQVAGGFQWVPGFWADAKQERIALLPEPPASLDSGPSSPAPGDNYLWAPGNWYWQNGEYVWQPGYWYEANPNWVWVPNHYSYTPSGYCYVSGYWDYPPYSRGLLYAPVYWGAGYRGGYGYGYYQPFRVINTALLIANLAVNHGWGHYYYGYWGGGYPGWLRPWGYNYGPWGYRSGNYFGYDPLWSYFRWSNRKHWDDDWWRDRNNWHGPGRDRDDWKRWSWDGRDWDGQGRGRDGRPGDRDGRPGGWDRGTGDRGPRDADIADRDRNRGRSSLVTSVDDLRRNGRNAIRTRELSQNDLERIRDRSQEFRSRRDNVIADAKTRAGADSQTRARGDWPSRGPRSLEGQLGAGARGQIDRSAGRGQVDVGSRARIGGDPDMRARVGYETQVRRESGNRGPVRESIPGGGLSAQQRAQRSLEARTRDQRGQLQRGQIDRDSVRRNQMQQSIDQLRGRTNRQGPTLDSRTYSRGGLGPQVNDRLRSQVPGNVQRSLQGPVQQRVMRVPAEQRSLPQGQSFRGRIEGQRSFSFPSQGGGGRSIQQAPRSIQRSLPGGGGGGRSIQQAPRNIQRSLPGGGGGGGRGPSFQGGGGGRGGSPFGGGGGRGGGGGGRGRGGRD